VEVGCEIVHFLSETPSPHRYSAGATLGRSPVLGRAIGELPPRRDIDGELVGVVPPVVLGVNYHRGGKNDRSWIYLCGQPASQQCCKSIQALVGVVACKLYRIRKYR